MDSVEPNTGEEEEGNTMDLHLREDILEMKTLIDQLPEEDCTTMATPMDSIVQITREDINPLMDGDGQDAGSYEPHPLGKAAAPMYRDISIPELREEMFPLMGGQNAPLAESRAAPMYREVQIRKLRKQNQPEMLQIEPLRSILQDKWDRFASKLFLMNFLVYVVYLSIFTTVAFYRKEGKPPFPLEVPVDYLHCIGEVISVLGAVWFIYKAITIFKRNRPNFKGLYTVYNDFLFFLQASLLLMATVLYFCGKREYIGFLVVSLALAWINVLYYSRGSNQLGIYSVMIQRMILGDLPNFLCVYSVLLFGFSAAIVALMKNSSQVEINNGTLAEGGSLGVEQSKDKKQSYYSFSFTLMEMFKFTIGMGNLEFTDHVHYKAVFHTLLILYIVLTYILLLNMLIALMGNTVERISQESENIWHMQRAFTILDIERTLPLCLKSKLYEEVSGLEKLENRRFIRVDEMNWKPWRSDAGVIEEEEPGFCIMKPQNRKETPENTWSTLLKRIRARRPL